MSNISPFVLMGLGTVAVLASTVICGAGEIQAPLVFAEGHEIGKNDYGRPVALIAAALGVKPDDFRKAFSGVTPAKGGPPSGAEARGNKEALLKVLGPLGVTNDRLDEVSDYYRFRPQAGALWKTAPAKGHAVIDDGKIKKIIVTEAGSGYSSLPTVTIKGMEGVTLKAALRFDKDFKKNGSVAGIDVIEKAKSAH